MDSPSSRATLPYGAIRVLDVESEVPRVLVRLELTYAELAALQQATYPGVDSFTKVFETRQAQGISDDLLTIIRHLSLESQEAYKGLAAGYIQDALW